MSMDIGKDLQNAYEIGYKQGSYDEKVETETKWIPVSTLLPSRDGKYLVSRGGYIYVYSYGIPLMPMNERNRRRGWYESTSEGDFYMDVDAWCSLPEPYREEGKE